MNKRIEFSSFNALALLLFYAFTAVFTMLVYHPLYAAVSLAAALAFAVASRGGAAVRFALAVCLPSVIFFTLFNLLFVHRGVSVFLFINGNPVTLESGAFGLTSGLVFAAVLMWFFMFNSVVGGDNIISAVARALPQTALIIVMVMRLIPMLRRKASHIADAQTMIGQGVRGKGLFKRIRFGVRVMSVLITLTLENGVKTCNSMRARGYGGAGRRPYNRSPFRFKDAVLSLLLLAAAVVCTAGFVAGGGFEFYPVMQTLAFTPASAAVFAVFTAVCFFPCAYTAFVSARLSLMLKGVGDGMSGVKLRRKGV